jgi:hypothetical protein
MARIFTESFEAQHFLRFSVNNGAVINATSLMDAIACASVTGGQYFEKTFGSGLAEFYTGMFFYPASSATQIQLLRWSSGATELGRLQQNTVTKVIEAVVGGVVVASSATALVDNTLYHVQTHLLIADGGSGVLQVKLDDTIVVNYAGDTKPGADTTIDTLRWHGVNGAARYDTLTVNNVSGAEDNTWPGIIRIQRMLPAGPGFYVDNWARNTGASNWQAVDEVPPDGDTTYIFTTSQNIYESFSMSDQSLANVNYKALITSAVAKKDSGTVQLAIGIRDDQNSTNYFGANSALGTSYGVVEERRTTDPSTGTTWVSGGINATQALIDST